MKIEIKRESHSSLKFYQNIRTLSYLFAPLLTFIPLATAQAQESQQITPNESVATAPNFETTVTTDALRSSYRKVFNKKEIEESGATNLVELLETKTNVTVYNSAFREDELYVRGGDASHVLVLVDGFPIYDAMSSKRTFKLNSINLASVKKIEVIKGSQVARYGGQGLSAVIKVETVSPLPNPNDFKVKGLVGDPDLGQSFVGKKRELYVDKSLSFGEGQAIQVGGYAKSDFQTSPVQYSSFTYPKQSAAVDGSWAKYYDGTGRLLLKVRTYDEEKEGILLTDDAVDFEIKNSHWLTGIIFSPIASRMLPTISVSYLSSERSYFHAVDSFVPFKFDQEYSGEALNFQFEQPIIRGEVDQLTVGGLYIDERGRIVNTNGPKPSRDGQSGSFDQQIYGVFTRATKGYDNFIIDSGLRWEHLPTESEDFSSDNFSAQLGATVDNFRVEYAKGVRAPTIHNLHDVIYGNPNLKTEKVQSLTAESTFEKASVWKGTIAGYYSIYKDLIEVTGSGTGSQNTNVTEAEVTGVEMDGAIHIGSQFTLDINTMYQNPIDKMKDKRIKYRPYHTHSAQLSWKASERWAHYISYYYSGDRIDFGSTPSTEAVLPSYNLYGLGIRYKTGDNFQANFKVQNLMDKRYNESNSFFSEGMRATVGFEYSN